MHPDILSERCPGINVDSIWLIERVGANSIPPDHLSKLRNRMINYMQEHSHAMAMLDGLEYLSLFNDFSKLQMFIEQMNDAAMESHAIRLIPIDPRLFDQAYLAKLRRFAEVVS